MYTAGTYMFLENNLQHHVLCSKWGVRACLLYLTAL